MKISRLLKIIAIICFTNIFILNLIALINQSKGYELSIYESTPLLFWIFLFINIFSGISIIIIELFNEGYKCRKNWILGFFILLFSRVSLIILPFTRGYSTFAYDHMSHIGLIKQIIVNSNIGENNFYPISHILSSQISLIINTPPIVVVNYITIFFSVFFVLSIFLLSKSLKNKKISIMAVASICPVLFNPYDILFLPNAYSLLFIPFFIYLLFKSKSFFEFGIISTITLIIFPFFHPLTSLALIMIFFIIGFCNIIFKIFEGSKIINFKIFELFPVYKLALISIIFSSWALSFKTFHYSIRRIFNAFFFTGGSLPLSELADKLNKINLFGFDLIIFFIKEMGAEIIFLSLAATGGLILINAKFKNKKFSVNQKNFFYIWSFVIFFGLIYFFYLVNIIPGIENIAADRLFYFAVIFSPIPASFTLIYILNDKKKLRGLIVIVLLFSASVLGIITVFPSPYNYSPNRQVTKSMIVGYGSMFNSANVNIGYVHIALEPDRFFSMLIDKNKFDGVNPFQISNYAPDHFNYSYFNNFGTSYFEPKYFILTKLDKIIYETVWKEVNRFNNNDFIKINNDETVEKIYDNNESNIYLINNVISPKIVI